MNNCCGNTFLPEIAIRPLGGGQDDAPMLSQVANANAGLNAVRLLPGVFGEPYLIQTQWLMPSGIVFRGTDKTKIIQSLPLGTGNALVAGFAALAQSAANSSVVADAVLFSRTLAIANNVTPGTYLKVLRNFPGGFRQYTYKVLAVTGSGPFTITLDHPIHAPFKAGDTINIITSPIVGIRIEGNGMTMTGTGARYIELIQGAISCCITDVHFDPSGGTVDERLVSLDEGSYNCHASGLVGDGGGTATIGYSFEGAENCSFSNCIASNCSQPGFLFQDGLFCSLIDNQAFSNGLGAAFSSAGNVEGSNYNLIQGGDYSKNYVGILIDQGASSNRVVGASVFGNTTDGVQFAEGPFSLTDNMLSLLICGGNGSYGIDLSSRCVGTIIEQCVVSGTAGSIRVPSGSAATSLLASEVNGAVISIDSDCQISGLRGTTPHTYLSVTANGVVRARGLNVAAPASAGNVIQISGRAEIEGSHVTVASGCNAFVAVSGGVLKISAVTVDKVGSGTATGLFSDTNSTIRIGEFVDVDNTTNPLFGAGYFSRGMSIVANGTGTGQDFSWPNIKRTDRVVFRLVTPGGTPTPAVPTYTITPGVKITVKFAAGDTSTYEPIIL